MVLLYEGQQCVLAGTEKCQIFVTWQQLNQKKYEPGKCNVLYLDWYFLSLSMTPHAASVYPPSVPQPLLFSLPLHAEDD